MVSGAFPDGISTYGLPAEGEAVGAPRNGKPANVSVGGSVCLFSGS